ncbi:rhizobactin siderophore biosynthesis protein RhsF [Paramesorhizobium deserti]|uniref:Rhizobactin siderophore biosynthesis protein RhsF n=1 Tax=Paramesorhizobium deserti TaxID=1494590 RepID=A0A135HT85_9HYPH|nr:IucA/IucC family protein [Paramesorhizobium deserti]KXF76406.1 rhizobactin siderophore biosynthesis protein RhsF [Paramesorhizobium deserti]
MPLPRDVQGNAGRSVMRRLAEAMIFEGLADYSAAPAGASCRFSWRGNGVEIRCVGFVGAFGRVRIEPATLQCRRGDAWDFATLDDVVASLEADREWRTQLALELDRTLVLAAWNDANLTRRQRRHLPHAQLDSALDEGHPYHPCFKARTGFDLDDHAAYGPEAGNIFQLAWLAVAPERLHSAFPAGERTFWEQELGPETFALLDERRAACGDAAKRFGLMPLHPWQWKALQGSELSVWLAEGSAFFLGLAGDRYAASQSVRTLFNSDHPERANVKLPMNLINSSAMRIIEPHSVCSAPSVSSWLKDAIAADPVFAERFPLKILGEYAGTIAGRDGPLAGQIAAIWREDVSMHLSPGEAAVPLNALMMIESDGHPFVAEWIDRYGLEQWVNRLINMVVMPIYHLLAGHGIATECHGQNLILIHRDGWPVGLAMRDFHDSVEYVPDFLRDPEKVPDFLALSPAYRAAAPNEFYWMESVELLGELVLDSLFVYNLAEISHLLHCCYGLDETSFWAGIGRRLAAHGEAFGLSDRMAALGLFKPCIRTESLLRRKLMPPGAECAHEIPNSLASAVKGAERCDMQAAMA